MSLRDVSKMITGSEKLCEFAESFTQTNREPLAESLTTVFHPDVPEGETPVNVLGLVNTLLRRLRRTLGALTLAETLLVSALKKQEYFRSIRGRTTVELQVEFRRARDVCRANFGPLKANQATFPARVEDDPLALLRQTNLVTWNLSQPDFDLGESLVPGSNASAETIRGIYEPKVAELREVLDRLREAKSEVDTRQVEKDRAMEDFGLTYRLFIDMVGTSFRLSGDPDLAKRLAPPKRGRPSSSEDEPPTEDGELPGPEDSPSTDEQPEAPPLPPEIARLLTNLNRKEQGEAS